VSPLSTTPGERDRCPWHSEQTTPRWFAREVHAHDGTLKSYLRHSFPSVRDVDDVVQESYLRIWKAKEDYPIISAKAFLFRVARHVALDLVRKRSHSPVESISPAQTSSVIDWEPNGVESLASRDTLEQLANAIAALPRRCREVIVLHKLKGMPQRDVASRLGLSARTVEKHCARALKFCERYLRDRGIRGVHC
jgi:RNA polymerase sigma factor (sigma-70 family)